MTKCVWEYVDYYAENKDRIVKCDHPVEWVNYVDTSLTYCAFHANNHTERGKLYLRHVVTGRPMESDEKD